MCVFVFERVHLCLCLDVYLCVWVIKGLCLSAYTCLGVCVLCMLECVGVFVFECVCVCVYHSKSSELLSVDSSVAEQGEILGRGGGLG